MRLSIHQPSYWPWLGYLDKISKSDTFVLLDHVQANKASYQYRNIFFCNGEEKILTLPVNYSHGILLNELEFKNDFWIKEHLNKLSNYYSKAPFYNEVFPLVEKLYESFSTLSVIDVLALTVLKSMEWYGLEVSFIRSSSLGVEGNKGELVFNICKETQCKTYVSGKGGLNYMDETILKMFSSNSILIEWQQFSHPVYSQYPKIQFLPGLASLDFLFFNGLDAAKKLFKHGK